MTELLEHIDVYKPSEILGMFQSYLAKQNTSAKVIFLKGVYLKSAKNSTQWAFCYDVVRDEDTQEEITVKITPKQRENLKDGNLVVIGGIIGRQIKQNGFIQLVLGVTRVEVVKDQVMTDTELKMMELRNLKSLKGFKNVDSLLENRLFSGEKPMIALLFASTSITMSDFNAGKNAASSHIDFTEHRVSFGNAIELSTYLQKLDLEHYDAIALIRGGGGGIESLDDLLVLETIVNLQTSLICAVGHVDEKLFIKNIADKVASTPNGLGSYFSEMVENVIQKKNRSRAILVEQVKTQFKEQIETANKQNKDLQEKITVLTKNNEVSQKMHAEQIRNTEKQNKDLQEKITVLTKNNETTQKMYAEQIKIAEKQNKSLQDQLSILTKNAENSQNSHKNQTDILQKQLILMQKELKDLRDSNENQTKDFNENISKMQLTNYELQKSLDKLNAENTQAAKDLTEAKVYAKYLEQQLASSKKKPGYFGLLIAIVVIIGLFCGIMYLYYFIC
ncbi:exonuclease VII large subunit [Candidatus Bacteroides intestinigallinarum]|jgi:exonuclease VII, large subunit domain protein|uniref:coiled-coil domain-containing protein n=1 Tax=Bacteroides TaxID=816 RepID=UPI000E7E3D86|nr:MULTISPECIES: exodeoxyribonuclease VII large subunit [Bacteroides]MCS3178310.1 exonuclease VII large subunit [Candidatus Bacteroides intestinigallinarum]RGN55663.1 exonuclease VII large subunit [Bacteroides sp. OM05-10AA]RGQ60567.1 exonuclease VII large subunit [Bacteroides sp. AF27-33]